jgi:hypothetical protein
MDGGMPVFTGEGSARATEAHKEVIVQNVARTLTDLVTRMRRAGWLGAGRLLPDVSDHQTDGH